MAVEFLDEAPAATGGVEFLDSTGVEFLDAEPVAADPADIEKRVADPFYNPTLAEFARYKDRAPKPFWRPGDWAYIAGQAATQVAMDLARGLKAAARRMGPQEATATSAEAVARGTFDIGMLAQPVLDKLRSVYTDTDESVFIARKTSELNQQAFPQGLSPTTEAFLPGTVPKPLLDEWRKEFADYKLGREYERFMTVRELVKTREQARRGEAPLVSAFGPPQTQVAEALSFVADPASIATAGAPTLPGMAGRMATRLPAAGLRGAGAGITRTGEAISAVARAPERLASAATRAITQSEEAAEQAARIARSGSIGATVVSPLVAVPGLTEAAIASSAGRAAGAGVQGTGQAINAAARVAAEGPSRFGYLFRVSKDELSAPWLRRAALAASVADPLVNVAGAAARGAAGGAAIGGGLGILASGDTDIAAAGIGSGLVLGAGGGVVSRISNRKAVRQAAEENDLATWLARKPSNEIEQIRSLGLSQDEALKFADLERLAGSDVRFRYLAEADFLQRFGNAKGAVPSGTAEIFINVGHRGSRPLFHEISHALSNLDFAPERTLAIDRILFTQTAPDGTPLSRGLFSDEDLRVFADQYRGRLAGEEAGKFDALRAGDQEAFMDYMRGEVRAEAMANFLQGSSSTILPRITGFRQRMVDRLLTAEQNSIVGRMRSGLERLGVQFKPDGTPSELFSRNGQPITNSPSLNAALRQYLRAKARVTQKLIADESESAPVTITVNDLARPQNEPLLKYFEDWDGFARNPDGSIQRTGGERELAAAQRRAEQALKQAGEAQQRAAAADQAVARAEAAARTAAHEAHRWHTEAESGGRVQKAKAKLAVEKARQQLAIARAAQNAADAAKRAVKLKREAADSARLAADAAAKSAGTPRLLSPREIAKVQARRVELMVNALKSVDEPDVRAMRLKENGGWEGAYFSDAQMDVIRRLPDDVLSPSMKAKLAYVNETLKRHDGSTLLVDYNAALDNKRYSSGISPTTRKAVPYGAQISKAGNFLIRTLDVTAMQRKLANWSDTRKKQFDLWNGDVPAFERDLFSYLDNHNRGLPGKLGLDADPIVAEQKRNVLNDFFNMPAGETDANPWKSSGKGVRDVLLRSRRFDRINRVTPGEGIVNFNPDIYARIKANLLPSGPVKATDNKLGFLNDVWAVRYPNESPRDVAAILAIAPRGGVELVNPGFPNYKAFITRSPKDPEFPWQTTWFYDDGIEAIPVGDRATTTLEDAIKVSLNAGFTHESLVRKSTEMR